MTDLVFLYGKVDSIVKLVYKETPGPGIEPTGFTLFNIFMGGVT